MCSSDLGSKPVSRIAAHVFSSDQDPYYNSPPDDPNVPAGFFKMDVFPVNSPQGSGTLSLIPKATVNSDKNIVVSWSKHRIPGMPVESGWVRCLEDRPFFGIS